MRPTTRVAMSLFTKIVVPEIELRPRPTCSTYLESLVRTLRSRDVLWCDKLRKIESIADVCMIERVPLAWREDALCKFQHVCLTEGIMCDTFILRYCPGQTIGPEYEAVARKVVESMPLEPIMQALPWSSRMRLWMF